MVDCDNNNNNDDENENVNGNNGNGNRNHTMNFYMVQCMWSIGHLYSCIGNE